MVAFLATRAQLRPRQRRPRERGHVRWLSTLLHAGARCWRALPQQRAVPLRRRDPRARRRAHRRRATASAPTPTSTAATSPATRSRPGVLLIEAMAQAGVVALGIYLLAQRVGARRGVEKLLTRLHRRARSSSRGIVRPGDARRRSRGRKVFFRRRKLRAEVEMRLEDGTLVCSRDALGHGGRCDEATRRRDRARRVAPNGERRRRLRARAARGPLRASARIAKLDELGFGCQVAGVPAGRRRARGGDVRRGRAARDELEPSLRRARRGRRLARRRPRAPRRRDDDRVDWDAGAILGTGIGGMDTIGEQRRAAHRRRQGAAPRQHGRRAGDGERHLGARRGLLALGNQVTTNSSACSTGTEAIVDGLRAHPRTASPSACCAAAPRARATTSGPASTRCACCRAASNDAPERASRPMSASAGGFVPGCRRGRAAAREPRERAARGARIHAEVLGGAVNCGGHRGGGSMTAPNPRACARCIRAALADAGIAPARGRRDQRPPDRDRRRPARGRAPGPRRSSARPATLPPITVDQVDDRPRARRRRRASSRVACVLMLQRRLRAPVAQLRGRAPGDRAVRGVDPARARARRPDLRVARQGGLRLRRRQRLPRVPAAGTAVDDPAPRRTADGRKRRSSTKVVKILDAVREEPGRAGERSAWRRTSSTI